MENRRAAYEAMLNLAAEMILDDALLKYRTEQIYAAIDHALAAGDADAFRKLAEEWTALTG